VLCTNFTATRVGKTLNRRSRAYLKVNFLKKNSGGRESCRSTAGMRNGLLVPQIIETEEHELLPTGSGSPLGREALPSGPLVSSYARTGR
jgi:hypothetical protein